MFKGHANRFFYLSFLIAACVIFTGCAKLKHLRELLLIKKVANEQSEVSRYVELKDERFDVLYSMVETGDVKRYDTAEKVLKYFGEPIKKQPAPYNARHSVWYYRKSTQFFGSPEVYLYFDEDNKLIDWKAQGGSDGKGKQETT